MTWDLDAASTYVLRGGRDPAEALRLAVVELVAAGAWRTRTVTRRRLLRTERRTVLVPGSGTVPPGVPARIDAQLRRLPAQAVGGAGWDGREAGVPLEAVAAAFPRAAFIPGVVRPALVARGLATAGRDDARPTSRGAACLRELDGVLGPLLGRRGRRLVRTDPYGAAALANAAGPAVLLCDDLHPELCRLADLGRDAGLELEPFFALGLNGLPAADADGQLHAPLFDAITFATGGEVVAGGWSDGGGGGGFFGGFGGDGGGGGGGDGGGGGG